MLYWAVLGRTISAPTGWSSLCLSLSQQLQADSAFQLSELSNLDIDNEIKT